MNFANCHTAADCKIRYKELAKELHPDKGGRTVAFQKMQSEYEARLTELLQESKPNTIEYSILAQHLLEILKITKPEYYELVRIFGNNPTVSLVSQLIGEILPKHKNTVNGILGLLK